MRRTIRRLGAAVLFLATTAVQADMVVIESINSSAYTPGTLVRSGEAVTLPSGASLTLIDAAGVKTMVIGPFEGTLAEGQQTAASAADGAPSVVSTLAQLFRSTDFLAELASLKSVMFRGVKPRVPPATVIEVPKQGHFCVPARTTPMFWRADVSSAAELRVEYPDAAQHAALPWPESSDSIAWPLDVKLVDGGRYRLGLDSSGQTAEITLHLMPADLPTRAHQASWMSEHKCERQAVLLLVTAKIDKFIDELALEGKF